MHTRIILTLFLLFTEQGILGQSYSYRHYTIKDGLPQSQVMSVYQDHRGYMWIGTKAGLSRFDGNEFQNYYMKDGLNSDFIEGFVEDTSNTLYILTPAGYNKFVNDTIISYKLDTNINLKWRSRLVVDSNNAIWGRLQETRDLVRFKDGSYTFMQKEGIIPDSLAVHSFCYDENRDRIFFSAGGRGIYYIKNQKLHKYWQSHPPKGMQITRSPGGINYGVNQDSIYRFENGRPTSIAPTGFSRLKWSLGAWDGQDNLYLKSNRYTIQKFTGQQIKPLEYKFNSINTCAIDQEGNMWVGTETGLTKCISRKFVNYIPENSPMIPYVYSVIEDSSHNLYFASLNEGLLKYDGKSFQKITGYKDVYNRDRFYMGGICDHQNRLVLPTLDGALIYDGKEFTKIRGLPRYDAVLDIYQDPDNKSLLFASEGGLFIREPEGSMKEYQIKPGGKPTGNITGIIKDTTGRYWLGGFKGLSWLKDGKIRHLPDSLYSYDEGAICLHRDYKGNIWLGTRTGLYLYDYNSFKKIAAHNIYSYVVSLTEVDSSRLVLGMIDKLATLDLKSFYSRGKAKVKTYNHTNGFLGNECIQNGLFTDSKGHVWIPTSNRVVRFMPDKGKGKNLPPQIYIEKINRLNEQMQWVVLSDSKRNANSFKLTHATNNLRFHYTGIDHSNPQGIHYQYKLKGNDKGWSEWTQARYATYTNLQPGSYTFKVRARNAKNLWSNQPAKIRVYIQPAFWQRTWFVVTALSLGIAAIIVILYHFTQRYKLARQKKAEYDKKMAEMKLLTVKNQLEPHFTFNALNSMAAVVLKEENLKAYDYLSKFSRMIRLSLEESEEILRTLKEEIDFVRHYLDIQKLRFDNKFDYQIYIQEELSLDFKVPKMIIHNYVENAIKHGIKHKKGSGWIKISLFEKDQYLNIFVEDDGIGRKKAREIGSDSSGKGLKTLREYCRIFNKYNSKKIRMQVNDLYDDSGRASGTKVEIAIPTNYKYNIHHAATLDKNHIDR